MSDKKVYSYNGKEAKYIQELPNGKHLVTVEYFTVDDFGDEICAGTDTQIWDRVFDSPPITRYAEELNDYIETIKTKQQTVRELLDKESELRGSISNIEKEIKTRQEAIKKHKGLENLHLFIEGKITKFLVIKNHKWEVKDFDETLAINDRFDKGKIRLLSLFGDSKGDLEWRLSQYYDGSGSYTMAIPCVSESDAREKAIEYFKKELDAHAHSGGAYIDLTLIDESQKLGLEIPDELLIKYKNKKMIVLKRIIDDYKKNIESNKNSILSYESNILNIQNELNELQ
jgi:hypothetical protein